jgi:tetratricopeptide (TPR) repeat protein
MTKYLSHALIVVLLVFLKMPLRADLIPEIVVKAKPANVEIVVTDATGAPKTLGKTVAQPPRVNLAILKFQDNVEGERVIVIGNPTGLTGSVSDGIISAFRENRSLFQITVPISQCSSGSPVMDEMGEVIGVATLENTQGQNSNFAIAVEKVSAALMQPPNEQFSGPALPTIDAAAHFDSGMAFLERQEYDKAINEFTEAIRLDPNYIPAYVSRGNAYGIQGAVDKAINEFTEAIRLDPNVAIIYFNRANAYYDHGNLDKASSDYNEAIRLDHNFARAYVGRGTSFVTKEISTKRLAITMRRSGSSQIMSPPTTVVALRTALVATTTKRSAILPRRSGSTQMMPMPTAVVDTPMTCMATSTRRSAITTKRFGSIQIQPSPT